MPDQPLLSSAEQADVERLMRAERALSRYFPEDERRTPWRDEGNGVGIAAMFMGLGVQPLAVALVITEFLNQITEEQQDNPESYMSGWTAGLAVGIAYERERQA